MKKQSSSCWAIDLFLPARVRVSALDPGTQLSLVLQHVAKTDVFNLHIYPHAVLKQ